MSRIVACRLRDVSNRPPPADRRFISEKTDMDFRSRRAGLEHLESRAWTREVLILRCSGNFMVWTRETNMHLDNNPTCAAEIMSIGALDIGHNRSVCVCVCVIFNVRCLCGR